MSTQKSIQEENSIIFITFQNKDKNKILIL